MADDFPNRGRRRSNRLVDLDRGLPSDTLIRSGLDEDGLAESLISDATLHTEALIYPKRQIAAVPSSSTASDGTATSSASPTSGILGKVKAKISAIEAKEKAKIKTKIKIFVDEKLEKVLQSLSQKVENNIQVLKQGGGGGSAAAAATTSGAGTTAGGSSGGASGFGTIDLPGSIGGLTSRSGAGTLGSESADKDRLFTPRHSFKKTSPAGPSKSRMVQKRAVKR